MGHAVNWYAGWWMLLAAFATGAVLGLFFWREDFMGGYAGWRRRLTRLGHIALAALGILNMVYGLAAIPVVGTWQASGASAGLILGGCTMPLVCFLSAWRMPLRHLFVIPVASLLGAAACVVLG
ncbi:MAG TPA: hypothetical protein VHM90_06035 [Phycisphaerae bacterium]|jgi:hypothetical protein|nr:hypothetical protein [Phycisphaerae bacterium]